MYHQRRRNSLILYLSFSASSQHFQLSSPDKAKGGEAVQRQMGLINKDAGDVRKVEEES